MTRRSRHDDDAECVSYTRKPQFEHTHHCFSLCPLKTHAPKSGRSRRGLHMTLSVTFGRTKETFLFLFLSLPTATNKLSLKAERASPRFLFLLRQQTFLLLLFSPPKSITRENVKRASSFFYFFFLRSAAVASTRSRRRLSQRSKKGPLLLLLLPRPPSRRKETSSAGLCRSFSLFIQHFFVSGKNWCGVCVRASRRR